MMTRGQKRFLIISIIVSVILVVLLILLFLRDGDEPAEVTPPVVTGTPQTTEERMQMPEPEQVQRPVIQAQPMPDMAAEERFVAQLARIFTETFNSYSSQNANIHIDNAADLATEEMAQWIRRQGVSQTENYQGVTTNVISTETVEYTGTTALVNVGTQQIVTNGTQETTYRYATVELDKVGESWKVDGFFWEE